MPRYQATKNYNHSIGLSCTFRQWRTKTACRFLHGYSLKVSFVFEGPLDDQNWVIGFGELKPVKAFLEETFDHKTVIAKDDPNLKDFVAMSKKDLIQLQIIDHVGMEKFCEYVGNWVIDWLSKVDTLARLVSVEISEHEGNSAKIIYDEPKTISPSVVDIGRLGGTARAASISPDRRSQISRDAARKRWAKVEV